MKLSEEHLAGLEAALRRGGDTHSLADVADAIEAGEAQLWVDGDSVIVTEILEHPRSKTVHFWLAAGSMDGVINLSHRILDWAKGEGCTRASLTGRKGWAKALISEGWEMSSVLMGRGV